MLNINSIKELNDFRGQSVISNLGIEFIAYGDDYITAKMPVDVRTLTPYGLLHGGSSVVLAETLGSIAANCTVDLSKQSYVGLEINANHIRGVKGGVIYGTARPHHMGRRTQIWEIKITNEDNKLVCISRITMMAI